VPTTTYELGDVFNEAKVPSVTYVTPKEAKYIEASLRTSGKHVTLVGASGSGKSTVAQKLIEKIGLTSDDVHTFSGREYASAGSFLEVLASEFGVAPDLEEVGEWLKIYDLVVVDDVHHLPETARRELATYLKLWHEHGIKFFLIGIARTSDEILGADPELAIRNDVSTLGAQDDDFLSRVMLQGEAALNVNFTDDFKQSAIRAAKGLPAIFQAICRIACVEAEVMNTRGEPQVLEASLPQIGAMVVRMFDPKYFMRIVGLAQGRRQARAVHDTFYEIVEALARSDKSQISKAELYRKVVGKISDPDEKKKKSTSFYRCMGTLQKVIDERRLSDILIYDSDTLSIDDPVLRFYLDHLDFSRVRPLVKIRKDIYDWDVALSFAGEDRVLVEELLHALEERGVEVFYDFNERAALWGKNLEEELAKIYSDDARFMVVCLSENYPLKDWTSFELEIGRAAAKKRTDVYLLPLILGDTQPHILGLRQSVAHMSIQKDSIQTVVETLIQKLGQVDVEDDGTVDSLNEMSEVTVP
jgi:hypothetical protein